MSEDPTAGAGRKITFERRYHAPLEEVWALWTTKVGRLGALLTRSPGAPLE